MLHLLYKWHVPLRDLRHKIHIRTIEHDMEVLNCMYGFERFPILEPDNLPQNEEWRMKVNTISDQIPDRNKLKYTYILCRHSWPECLLHIVVNLFSSFWCQVINNWVVFQLELGPDYQVDDLLSNTIRPIIVQYLNILCRDSSKSQLVKIEIIRYIQVPLLACSFFPAVVARFSWTTNHQTRMAFP